MIRINLLPARAAKKKESARQQLSIAGLSVVLLLIIVVVINYYKAKEIDALKVTIGNKEKELAVLKAQTGELTQVREENKVVKEKLDVVRQLEHNKAGPVRLLDEIGKAMPDKAWINKLNDTETSILMMGNALSDEDISQFMKNLENMPGIKKVELEIVEMEEKAGVKMKRFSIKVEKISQAAGKA